jgi:hypothetical protein
MILLNFVIFSIFLSFIFSRIILSSWSSNRVETSFVSLLNKNNLATREQQARVTGIFYNGDEPRDCVTTGFLLTVK